MRALSLAKNSSKIDALYEVTRAIDCRPDYIEALKFRASLYNESRSHSHAIKDLSQVLELTPADAETFKLRGATYSIINEIDAAISDYKAALSIKNDAETHSLLGAAYLTKGQYQEAKANIYVAMKEDAANPRYCLSYAESCFLVREYEETVEYCSKAILSEVVSLELAFFYRACARYFQGDFDGSIVDFSKSIELNPTMASSFANRADAYNRLGKFEEALEDCSTAISIQPEFGEPFFHRAVALDKLERIEEAVVDYSMFLKFSKKDFTLAHDEERARNIQIAKTRISEINRSVSST